MIHDRGPTFNLGFGVNSRQHIPWDEGEKEGVNPEAGGIAKALHDHPVMRFFAATAATMVGVGVASAGLRRGGVKLGIKLQQGTNPWQTNMVKDLRRVREIMDEWQGVSRSLEWEKSGKLFLDDQPTAQMAAGDPITKKGFWFTEGEKSRARLGEAESPAEWTWKQELQQRMVSQARRLPYELPAFYMVQRGLTDTIFGENQEAKPVNWANPADVITDFVTQSVKNVGFALLPFESGAGLAKHTWRKFMTYGDDMVNLTPGQYNIQTASVGMKTILERVGIESTDLIHKTLKYSAQSAGAVSTGITEARATSVDLVKYLHDTRHGIRAANADVALGRKTRTAALRSQADLVFSLKTLDQMPGPLRGFGTGIEKGVAKFKELGQGYDAFDKMTRMGRTKFEAAVTRGDVTQADVRAMKSVIGTGSTAIEELAGRINTLAKGGPATKAWYESEFYKGQLQSEYAKQLERQLVRGHEVDARVARKFSRLARVSPLADATDPINMTQRIHFGQGPIFAPEGTPWQQALQGRLRSVFGDTAQTTKIAQNLEKAIAQVDNRFANPDIRNAINQRIANQWKDIDRRLVPKLGEDIIGGHVKRGYEEFADGTLTAAKRQFLQRRSAQKLGMNLLDDTGGRVSDDMVSTFLKKKGFSPDNPYELRSFLIDQKIINAPWNTGARNVFGMRSVTVNDALQRGYFHTGKRNEDQIRRILNTATFNDPVSGSIGGFKLGGVYESKSGQILDFNRITRGLNRSMHRFADEVQIPLIGVKPLNLLGMGLKRSKEERSILQFIPGHSNQPFLQGKNVSDEFYFWVRGQKRTRGSVWAYRASGDSLGTYNPTKMEGTYSPFGTDAVEMGARHARLAMGDMGQGGVPHIPSRVDRFIGADRVDKVRQFFNVDANQPDSIFRFVDRFRKRRTDLNNPNTMAKLLRGEEITHRGQTLRMNAEGQVVNQNGLEVHTVEEVGTAFNQFAEGLRKHTPSNRVIKHLQDRFPKLTSYNVKPGTEPPITLNTGTMQLADIQTPAQYQELADRMLSEHRIIGSGLSKEKAAALRRAEKGLVYRHLNKASGPAYWDAAAPANLRSGNLYSRLDLAKADLYKYNMISRNIIGGSSLDSDIADVMAHLSKLKLGGKITQAEFTETQAALLSTQINFGSFMNYGRGLDEAGNIMNTIKQVRGSAQMRESLDVVASGQLGTTYGGWKANNVASFLRRHYQMADYDRLGTQYNPVGADTVLVPSFRTALENNRAATLKSVTGVSTWDNPEGFSGASIPMAHMFDRLNRYFGTFGGSLDVSAFKGPLDLYARGMIGKRVLPIVAGGTGVMAIDRTIGGFVNEKDAEGDRVYSPYFLGQAADLAASGQVIASGLLPGGLTAGERREQLEEGEVAVRSGRWWPLGSTPWKGGRIQYFRPSWLKRLKSGHMYTEDTFGSPLERAAFGYDFSPLRPLDPYRFERKHFEDRPYPITGEYFSGPWGPLTPALNMTLGKVLKPQVRMHKDEVEQGLGSYVRVGDAGAYMPAGGGAGISATGLIGGAQVSIGGGSESGSRAGAIVASNNRDIAMSAGPTGRASETTNAILGGVNDYYAQAAYGIPTSATGFPAGSGVVGAARPQMPSSLDYQSRELAFRAQEMFGIYGFGFGALRDKFGFGNMDMTTPRPVLGSAAAAYGSTRGFWDMNLGGLGDLPLPVEGRFGNLEISEIVRRFVPKERAGLETINPIPNAMGKEYPWLPGSDYFMNFHLGDPYTMVQEGEARLPGKGYERLHKLHSDSEGKYGLVDQHKILGDVAPWSPEYQALDSQIDGMGLSSVERQLVEQTRSQVEAKSHRYDFTPYQYKHHSAEELGISDSAHMIGTIKETLQHANSYLNTKFAPYYTAQEEWERNNVYGATFPQWSTPIESFIKPAMYNATQRNPLSATLVMGTMGALFGVTPHAKAVGGFVGGLIGLGSSLFGKGYEATHDERFMPSERRRQLATEEYVDILSYVKYQRLKNIAASSGDAELASEYSKLAGRTMYGADVYGAPVEELAMAIPKRKREHFRSMVFAPPAEREQILSTAGRLERRLLQGVWGMPVEEKPELAEYFEDRELPNQDWAGWHPNTSMDNVKIKIGQSLGIEMSEMGYYPQQIREANVINPSYPNFNAPTQGRLESTLRKLLSSQGIGGDVVPIQTPYPGTRVELNSMT